MGSECGAESEAGGAVIGCIGITGYIVIKMGCILYIVERTISYDGIPWVYLAKRLIGYDEMRLVQHCVINGEYCTCYFCQHCVVVNQRCHRIASFLRLVLTKISGTLFTIIYAMLY